MRHDWVYVALCLVVPFAWGIVSARVFDWWQARHGPQARSTETDAVDMYHI